MGNPTRPVKPIISNSIGEAAGLAVLDGLDAGFDIEDIAPDKGPKIRGEAKFSQEGLDELVSLSAQGRPIPGQSLTNSPAVSYTHLTLPTILRE